MIWLKWLLPPGGSFCVNKCNVICIKRLKIWKTYCADFFRICVDKVVRKEYNIKAVARAMLK